MGALGSILFFGVVIGSTAGAFVFKNFDHRTIILMSLLTNAAFLFLFSMVQNYYLLSAARFFSGFFQVFIIIYKVIFVDTFASQSQKPVFMSLILVSPPLGVTVGYLLTATIIQ